MRRIRLRVAYDGTDFCGWQIQPDKRTVEGELDRAIGELLKVKLHVIGASRTDAGVHALGNVAVFDTDSPIPAEKFCFAINRYLPKDVRVQSSEEVPPDWHPRHCDCRKTYEYRILNRPVAIPTESRYSWLYHPELSLSRMQQAASCLVGTHDFKSFCSARTDVESTVRTIYHLDVEREENLILIRVEGNGFLYNMVRIIAGTLVQVGEGKIAPERIPDILSSLDRKQAGITAPPHGLRLVEICYDD